MGEATRRSPYNATTAKSRAQTRSARMSKTTLLGILSQVVGDDSKAQEQDSQLLVCEDMLPRKGGGIPERVDGRRCSRLRGFATSFCKQKFTLYVSPTAHYIKEKNSKTSKNLENTRFLKKVNDIFVVVYDIFVIKLCHICHYITTFYVIIENEKAIDYNDILCHYSIK